MLDENFTAFARENEKQKPLMLLLTHSVSQLTASKTGFYYRNEKTQVRTMARCIKFRQFEKIQEVKSGNDSHQVEHVLSLLFNGLKSQA